MRFTLLACVVATARALDIGIYNAANCTADKLLGFSTTWLGACGDFIGKRPAQITSCSTVNGITTAAYSVFNPALTGGNNCPSGVGAALSGSISSAAGSCVSLGDIVLPEAAAEGLPTTQSIYARILSGSCASTEPLVALGVYSTTDCTLPTVNDTQTWSVFELGSCSGTVPGTVSTMAMFPKQTLIITVNSSGYQAALYQPNSTDGTSVCAPSTQGRGLNNVPANTCIAQRRSGIKLTAVGRSNGAATLLLSAAALILGVVAAASTSFGF